ncbi:MAG: redoxin domain-containing protein [Winogradskyella sp.]|uniref:redoxin domain-containing protein n=1 Tax=Winogradskyella sp. TaxID=1883156 RepID=UPI00385CECF2
MKKLFIFICASVILFSCKEEPKRTDFVINGTAKGVYNGIRVHLNSIDARGRDKIIDTKMIVNESFSFEGSVEAPTLYNITINSIKGKLPIMVENSEISIEINKDQLTESTITGSKSQANFTAYQNGIKAIEKDIQAKKTEMRRGFKQESGTNRNQLAQEMEALEDKKLQYNIDAIKDNSDSTFSLYLMNQDLKNPKIDIEKYMELFNNLSSELKTSETGKALKTTLDTRYNAFQKTAQLQIGKKAPSFEAPKPDGSMLSLDEVKGKVTIIDFWAAWCGPCRRENPNVVKIYEQYHNQGLEIIGVSLDGSRTQKEPKKLWLDAIEKDKLTWHQVSNLQYFNDPVAKLYNITSIPATYILDKNGNIAAKNLRGRALELKVAELINQ